MKLFIFVACLAVLGSGIARADDIVPLVRSFIELAPGVSDDEAKFGERLSEQFPELSMADLDLMTRPGSLSPGDWIAHLSKFAGGANTTVYCRHFGPTSLEALRADTISGLASMSQIGVNDLKFDLIAIQAFANVEMPENATQALSCEATIAGRLLEVDLEGAAVPHLEQDFEMVRLERSEPGGPDRGDLLALNGPLIRDTRIFVLGAGVEFAPRDDEPARAKVRMIAFELAGQS